VTAGDGPRAAGGCSLDAGAYVLRALDPAEAQEFRVHLASCAVCRDEVAALRVAARMPSGRLALAGAGSLTILAGILAAVLIGGGSKSARTLRASVAVPSASATVRLAADHGELELRRMPPAPAGHIYEVWLQRGHGPPLATSVLFNVTSSGAAVVGLPGDLGGVRAILVTAERLGGSLRPTRAPVIVAPLA
jgi:anti-sigma-K factor RskA/putative zinc finger protein